MISNEYTLSQSFGDSIKEELIDIIGELSEVGLDTIIEDEILKSIPFVSTAISVYKIGTTIREKHHLKKIATFIGVINEKIGCYKKEQYIKKFKDDKKFREHELEYIIIILDRYLDYNKPQWLAKLYLAYLDEFLSWREFSQFAEIVDTFLPGDEIFLRDNKVPRDISGSYYDIYVERFCALGLIEKRYIDERIFDVNGKPVNVKVQQGVKNSELGIKLFNIIFGKS